MRNGLPRIFFAAILTIAWILCFIYIRPTLVIDFGAGLIMNFRLFVIFLGLLIIVLYHIQRFLFPASTEVNKLSLTVCLTVAWLALVFFYHFQPLQGTEAEYAAGIEYDGTIGFFSIVGGLAVCLLWIRFFADEISLEDRQ